MTTTELNEEQRGKRRAQARKAIESAFRERVSEWATYDGPDFALASDIAMDALGDTAAEILTDGTMLRGLDIRDGVVTLDLEPAKEILQIFVASMRGVIDGYGAENYVETQWETVSMDLSDSDAPQDAYTVTIQRRERPTPHEFRQRAEAERDAALLIVAEWCTQTANTEADAHPHDLAVDLMTRLIQAGITLPEVAL